MFPRWPSSAVLVLAVLYALPVLAQRGVPQSGFPLWQERVNHVLINRARAEPTAEMKTCSETAVRPPVVWSYNLNRAARFQSANLQKTQTFAHDSPCNLVSNLSDLYLPNGACDGAPSCACVNGQVLGEGLGTKTFTRIAMFGTPGSGENIAAGYPSPEAVHAGWMMSSGHCSNILAGHGSVGVGWFSNYWTQNFGGGSPTGTLIAGAHSPQFTGGTPVEFRVNYYNTAGGPQGAQINVDGTCSTMTLERGTQTNGTWLHTQPLSGTACRRYFFVFADPAGNTVYLPETGSYGVGGSVATCPDWEPGTPQGCGPLDKFPTVATAASANPATTGGDETSLSALGADDNGEGNLTYTWSSTGPVPVSFTPNGINAAKSTTATFGRAGTYSLTVSIRDGSNQAVTSSTSVTVTQTPSQVTVTPATAAVATGTTRQFSALAIDQFGQPLMPPPSFTWTVTGGGSVNASGLFTAGEVTGGPHTLTAAAGSVSGTAQVLVGQGQPPLITEAARATPNPVTGTTTVLSVLATDDNGDELIRYAWSVSGPAPVTFSENGNDRAKTTTATFTQAGTYAFTVAAQDANGLATPSEVTVEVVQAPVDLRVTPLQATVRPNNEVYFVARARDQFDRLVVPPPDYTWSVSGGGSIDDEGVYTAGGASGGPHTVTATAGGLGGTAQVVVTPQDALALAVALSQPAPGARLVGKVKLVAQVNDAPRVARVRFTVDDVDVGEAQVGPYELLWDTTTHADGDRRLRAGVVNGAGETVWSPEVPVTLTNGAPDTTPPQVTVNSPAPGPLSGLVLVSAEASDDRGVARVHFAVDGVTFDTDTTPPYGASFDASTLADGEHLLTVTAVDDAGNEGRADVAFTVGEVAGCGCAGGGAGALFFPALVLAAGVLRRRRSR